MEKRFENLMVKGTDTGYRYMGTLEEAQTLGILYDKGDLERRLCGNILEKDSYAEPILHCKAIGCEKISDCTLKTDVFDKRVECEEFDTLEKEVIQTVVYYNELINSAVVFEVLGDFCVGNHGFDNINELIDDIYSSSNSPFVMITEDKVSFNKFMKALESENNLVYFSYINSDFTDDDVDYYYRSLKGKKIRTIVDILKEM